jgi:hypothetical protein
MTAPCTRSSVRQLHRLAPAAAAASLVAVGAAGTEARAQAATATHELREELRIVSSETVPGMLLTGVSDLTVLPDGRIITLHAQERLFRVFDTAGSLMRTVGRRGQGPGEFEMPRGVGYVGDTIWVHDLRRSRYLLFGPDFEPAGSVAMVRPGGIYHGLTSATTSMVSPAGDTGVIGIYEGERLLHPIRVPYRVAGHQYQVRMDVGAPAGMVTGRTTLQSRRSPLSVRTNAVRLPGGREAAILESAELWGGRPGQLTIRYAQTATGNVSAPVTVSLPPRRVTASQADSIIAAAAGRGSASNQAQVRANARVPTHFPAYSSATATADGTLWLSEYGEPGTRLVLDRSGATLMRVRIPERFSMREVSRTHVWGTYRDADDLPIIVRYRIVPVGGSEVPER